MKTLRDFLYHEEDAGVIYCGDCLEILPLLPENSVDLVVTDPPYSFPINQFRPKARINQRGFGDFSSYQYFFGGFIDNINRIIKPDGDIVIFCDETFYAVLFPILYSNFYANKLVIWDKQKIGMGGIWRRSFELFIHSYLLPKAEKSGDPDIIKCSPVNSKDKKHNSQKPVDLITRIIAKLKQSPAIILDPFFGSGSTLVAAKELAQPFIGIEIEPKYCEIAKQRLAQEELPL